ncbi:S41 family peptidase [Mariniflexile ostreae]|uniref:S41 family peptidase n=1 Tax=Mariniflexile ostreae TaxID=1520892 RepID=A0ABV5FEM8_9FLAO
MKNFKAPFVILCLTFFITSCYKDNDDHPSTNSSINDFVWKGMNSWYNWQLEVPELSDTKDDDTDAYEAYLNQFDSPKALFNSLRFQYAETDRFSWFVEDYIALQQQFQGISKSFGLKFQAIQTHANGDVVLFVKYVANHSPGSKASIKRGDLINAINGSVLNINNLNDLATHLSNESVTLSFVSENNGVFSPLADKTIASVVLSENPVHVTKVFPNINGKKVGYLVYNSFRTAYHDELNAAFSVFKNENINILVLDLRLNGGGSVLTSAYLSSMIYADAGTDPFAILKFNDKHTNENHAYHFSNQLQVFDTNDVKIGVEEINRLNMLEGLYILTSDDTASASEMVINGLKPYMPSVKLVGTTTYGKNVGSITLYDTPATDFQGRQLANPTHTKAMQPIVFQIFNKNGESDYTQGFNPDIEVEEAQYWNSIKAFGDENEVVLKAALDDIRGVTTKSNVSKLKPHKTLQVEALSTRFEKEMYIENTTFNN